MARQVIQAKNVPELKTDFDCTSCAFLKVDTILCRRMLRREKMDITVSGKCLNKWRKQAQRQHEL